MCAVGDIIRIESYISEDGVDMSRHSFIVIDDESSTISGYSYDFIANVMSSFKSEEHKEKKLRYLENVLITEEDRDCNPENGKEAYVKADQLYYFDKSKINYTVMGTATDEIMNTIYDVIEILDKQDKIKINIRNTIKEEVAG